MTTWSCDAYASWQKGSALNTNGRLRRQLPRHLDLDTLSRADLQEIVLSLNLTPRNCLGCLTPIQAFSKGLGKDIQIRFARSIRRCAWRGNPPPPSTPWPEAIYLETRLTAPDKPRVPTVRRLKSGFAREPDG